MQKPRFSSSTIFHIIAQFYYLLLKAIKVSEPFALIMIFMSCSQNLSFIISASFFIRVLSDDLSAIIYKVVSVFRPLYIINTLVLPSLYYFLLSLSLIYMVFYLLIIIAILHKNSKKTAEMPILMAIFKRMSYMNFYLWYIPLNEILLTPIYCVFITEKDSVEELFSIKLCIGGSLDVFLGLMGVFFYGFMTVTCLLNVLFFVDMTYNSNNALAKSDSLMELFAFISKNLLIILLIFLKYLQKPGFFLAFLIFLEINHIIAFREFIRKPNFFNPRVEKFYGLTLFLELYVFSYCLLFTILNVFGSEANTGLGLLLTILLPFRLFLNNFQNNYLKNLSQSLDMIGNPSLIDKKLKRLFTYLKSQDLKKAQNQKKRKFNIHYTKNESRILVVWGYLYNHLNSCTSKSCFCKNEDERLFDYSLKYEYKLKPDNPTKNLENQVYLKYFIRQQYKDSISMMKTNLGLRLNLAYFNFFQLNHYHQALLEAFELNAANIHLKGLNYRSLFLIKRLELEIRDMLENLNENKENDENFSKFNIEEILKLEENYSKLESKIAEFRILYTKFFFKLSNTSIKLLELESDCAVLLILRNEIEAIFEENLKENPRAIKLYMGYLNNLVFKNDQGYSLERRLKDFLEKIQANEGQSLLFYKESLIYNENSMIFQVGGEYKNLGKILKTNQGSGKILGYQIQELELSNINVILSFRLKRVHDQFLENFMKTGRTEQLYKENIGFLRKKNGYLINSSFVVKPCYNTIINEFRFLGFIRPLKQGTEFIVTDMYGTIEGMTENLSKLFNIHPSDYERSAFYIQILCPKLYSFFIERAEKVHNIFHEGSQSESQLTSRTNRTRKFKEVENIDLMEILDLPKTMSNEAILRFYRYNEGELFVDLRSIINAIIEKLRKKKFDETNNPETPKGMDKWNLVKRKFIKIAMMGNFFNCKTKINYFKSSDTSYEWLIFSITEIEFTRKLKIMQMANKATNNPVNMNSPPNLAKQNSTLGIADQNLALNRKISDAYDPTIFNSKFPSILNNYQVQAPSPISINGGIGFPVKNMNFSNIATGNNRVTFDASTIPTSTATISNNNNPGMHTNNNTSAKSMLMRKSTLAEQPLVKESKPAVHYIKEFAQTGIERIVIHPELTPGDEEDHNLLVASEGELDLEGLVQERIAVPVEEVRKNLDLGPKRKGGNSSPKKRYGKQTTAHSTLKEFNQQPSKYSGKWGKTIESMNSSHEFGTNKFLYPVPNFSIETNPFIEAQGLANEAMPLNPSESIEDDEEKMADNIINFNGNQLFEDKSEDYDPSVQNGQSSPKKSLKGSSPGIKLGKRNVGFKARFEAENAASPTNKLGGASPKKSLEKQNSSKFKGFERQDSKVPNPGIVNKDDLKMINKTLKDISKGLTRGVDDIDDDSDRKTVKSTRIGARTIKTIKSMNKKTNMNVNFTPKTHKLLDILRDTIVKKLALEDDGKKKEKAYEQSVHSSISSMYQSHRLTEKAIMSEYLPKCYRRLSWSLFFLLVSVFAIQISIYLIIVRLYDGFKINLVENVNYDKFGNCLLQSLKGIFMTRTLGMNQSLIAESEYFRNYLQNSLQNQMETIAGLLNHIQLNYDFYNSLSKDFFTQKSYYNLTISQNEFGVFPFDIIKAVTVYLSELQKMVEGQEFNKVFTLDNLFGISYQLANFDFFDVKRTELITSNKLAITLILSIVSAIILGIFFIRIYSHLVCYDYMNFVLEMLAKINFEDVETLKGYFLSISSVYDLQQEMKGPGNPNQMLGINYLETPSSLQKNDPNNKNRSHRLMDLDYLSTPRFQIITMNSLLAIFIIGVNLIVVLLSHGFDSHFEESGNLQRQLISQFNFKGYSNGFVLTYDRSLDLGVYNLSNQQIMQFLTTNLPNDSLNENSYQSENSFVSFYLETITKKEMCSTLSSTFTLIARCEGLLNGLLKKSLINFEVETFQKLKLMTLDQNNPDINEYFELGEALDYALLLVDEIRAYYITNESRNYDSETSTLVLINVLSICFSFFMMTGYYFFSLRKLARRLIDLRRIFIQIPIAILLRQKRVKKYLQDTSNFYLGG